VPNADSSNSRGSSRRVSLRNQPMHRCSERVPVRCARAPRPKHYYCCMHVGRPTRDRTRPRLTRTHTGTRTPHPCTRGWPAPGPGCCAADAPAAPAARRCSTSSARWPFAEVALTRGWRNCGWSATGRGKRWTSSKARVGVRADCWLPARGSQLAQTQGRLESLRLSKRVWRRVSRVR
jgi:hypothetical protein